MDESSQVLRELAELRETVRELTGRLFALEQESKSAGFRTAEAAPPVTSNPASLHAIPQPLPVPPLRTVNTGAASPPAGSTPAPARPTGASALPVQGNLE